MKNSERPPSYLSDAAKKWWKRLNEEFAFSADCLMILEGGLQAWDRWMEAKAVIDKEGITTTDRFGQIKQHPATLVERDSRFAFMRAFKQLGLEDEAAPVGKPLSDY